MSHNFIIIIIYLHSKRSYFNIGYKREIAYKSDVLRDCIEFDLSKNQKYYNLINILYNLRDLTVFNFNPKYFCTSIKNFIISDTNFTKLINSNSKKINIKNNIGFQIEFKNNSIRNLKNFIYLTSNKLVLNEIYNGIKILDEELNCIINNNIKKKKYLKEFNVKISGYNI